MNPKITLIIGILCVSFSPIFVRLAVAPPATAAFYRMFIALLCIFPYCLAKGRLKARGRELYIALFGGAIFGADIAAWNVSLTQMSATVSTLVANLTPIWVGVLSLIFYKQLAGRQFWIGTLIALIGIVILAGYHNIFSLKLNSGLLFALLSSLLYAVFILVTKSIIKSIDTLTMVFYNLLGATIFLGLICGIENDSLFSFSTSTWLCFIALGLICQLTGWLSITHTLRFLPSTKVSLALLSRAVIAGCWAALLLHEKLGLNEILGSAIILVGIAITFLNTQKAKV